MAETNKKTLDQRIDAVATIFKASGYNPFEAAVNQAIRLNTRNISLANQGKIDVDCEKLEMAVNSDLCKYVSPQLKSVELSGQVDSNITGEGVTVNLSIGNKQAVEAFTAGD